MKKRLVFFIVLALLASATPARAQGGLPGPLCWEELLGLVYRLALQGLKAEFLIANPAGGMLYVSAAELTSETVVEGIFIEGLAAKHLNLINECVDKALTMTQANDWFGSMARFKSFGFGFYKGDFKPCTPPPGGSPEPVPVWEWDPAWIPEWLRKPPPEPVDELPWAAIVITAAVVLALALLAAPKLRLA